MNAQDKIVERRPPRWARIIGWTSLALALLDVIGLLCWAGGLLPAHGPLVAVPWLIAGASLPAGVAFLLGLPVPFMLGGLVLAGTLLAGWCMLAWGGIGLLRRNSTGATVLLFQSALSATGNIVLGAPALFSSPPLDMECFLAGASWPLLVTVWMFRPSILKKTASWAPAPPEHEAEKDR